MPLLVNDRVDVALAAGADGVHIGWDDMAPQDARRLLGPDAIIGLSINSVERAKAAAIDLIDYAGIGGVYGTTSKATKAKPIGTEGLAQRNRRAARASPGLSRLRHRGHQCGQRRGGDRGRSRRRFGDFRAFDGARSDGGRGRASGGGRCGGARRGRR